MAVRLTARSRLALLHTGLVLVAGVVLTALTYVLVRRSMRNRWVIVKGTSADPPTPTRADDRALPPVAEQLRSETLNQLLTQSALALTVVTLLAGLLGWLIAGRVLRPIRAISATARRLSAANMSERVPVNAPADEVAALADTVNGMLDRIQLGIVDRDRLLDSQRMFVANAAHELRTPLTTIRTAIDVTLDGKSSMDELVAMAADVRTAIEHSQRTLDGLLTLARSQTGPTNPPSMVDLAELAAGIIDDVTDRLADEDLELNAELRSAPTCGEPILLERMLNNLVDNAIRYNRAGGQITITTGTVAEQAVLHISNTGRRTDPQEVGGLLEPFVRGTGNHTRTDNGAGLGLSIVNAVVLAHHGQITATARPTGGMDIAVALPLAPDRRGPDSANDGIRSARPTAARWPGTNTSVSPSA